MKRILFALCLGSTLWTTSCVAVIPLIVYGAGMGAATGAGFYGTKALLDPSQAPPQSPQSNQNSAQSTPNSPPFDVIGSESTVPEILASLKPGSTVAVTDILADELDGGDAALARLERGRIASIVTKPDTSIPEFVAAIAKIEEFDQRATVSASDVGAHAAALVVNDTMIPYEPDGFEKVLAYHFQALNYLSKKDLEGAGVEVRRANAEQVTALKAHEAEVAKAENEAKDKGFKTSDFAASVSTLLGDSQVVAGQVKNSFQNAYTFYMSGVVHELLHEPNDAYIDYKKALEIYPTNPYVQQDVARLAAELHMLDDVAAFTKQLKISGNLRATEKRAGVDVIVLFEDGLVPPKSPIAYAIPIPIPSALALTAIAIPTFKVSLIPAQPLVVTVAGKELGKTATICHIDALAVKAFEEKAPAMIARQIVRAAIKAAASGAASKYGGAAAGAAVGILNKLTEKADTRSWRSLPQNAQVFRGIVPVGSEIKLFDPASGKSNSFTAPRTNSSRIIVRATRLNGNLFVSHVEI